MSLNSISPLAGLGMGRALTGAAMVGRQAISSEMRSRAPEAFWISPNTSPSSRAEEAASIDSISS